MSSGHPRIVREPISLMEVQKLANSWFGDMVKASVDVGRGVMAIGGELHSDEEALLLEDGAKQSDARRRRSDDSIQDPPGRRRIGPPRMTPAPAHPSLAAGRWQTLSLMEQLGNVGSEVDRAIRAHVQGRPDRFEAALDRALELFDLTASDPRWNLRQRREILRAREQFCRIFFDETAEPDLANYLSRYFLEFAVAARREPR